MILLRRYIRFPSKLRIIIIYAKMPYPFLNRFLLYRAHMRSFDNFPAFSLNILLQEKG